MADLTSLNRLCIIHYHLRIGGVRKVIELALPSILQERPEISTVTFAVGERSSDGWEEGMKRTLNGVDCQFVLIPEFQYFAVQTKICPLELRRRIQLVLTELVGSISEENTLLWAHNLGLGRSFILTQEVMRFCRNRKVKLLLQHHDFWFENRWNRWSEIQTSGCESVQEAMKTTFSLGSKNILHAFVSRWNPFFGAKQQNTPFVWLPNPVNRNKSLGNCIDSTRKWLRKELGDSAPVWLVPARVLRRKNLAEAILLKQWLQPEGWLIITGSTSSAEEKSYFEGLKKAEQQNQWRVRFEFLSRSNSEIPTVEELIIASEVVLSTSLDEGFGLVFIEAAALGVPFIGRRIQKTAADFEELGIQHPYLYNEIWIDTDLLDWEEERKRQKAGGLRWKAFLPRELQEHVLRRKLLQEKDPPRLIAFSGLTLKGQLEVLFKDPQISWQKCASANPFLVEWKQLIKKGELQLAVWNEKQEEVFSSKTYAKRFWKAVEQFERFDELKEDSFSSRLDYFLKKSLNEGMQYPLFYPEEED